MTLTQLTALRNRERDLPDSEGWWHEGFISRETGNLNWYDPAYVTITQGQPFLDGGTDAPQNCLLGRWRKLLSFDEEQALFDAASEAVVVKQAIREIEAVMEDHGITEHSVVLIQEIVLRLPAKPTGAPASVKP